MNSSRSGKSKKQREVKRLRDGNGSDKREKLSILKLHCSVSREKLRNGGG